MDSQQNELIIQRYDLSSDKSLKAHSTADEYLLRHFSELKTKPSSLAIYNDRFGYLTCHLNSYSPAVVTTNKSHEKAIQRNVEANKLSVPQFIYPLSPLPHKVELVLMKAPKSLALFELLLNQISQNSASNVIVVLSFMTRHFTPSLIARAEKYFEHVEQTRAVKKARLMILTGLKKTDNQDIIDSIHFNNKEYKQYWGVFSSKNIDYASQYFLEHLELTSSDECILDLASGNGVLGCEIAKKLPAAEIHFMDDFYLAVASAKLNIAGENIHHYYNNDVVIFEDDTFDLIVTNPPFHFEYEVNPKITIALLQECHRCLKPGGSLQLVSNKHLNYNTHLKSLFSSIEVLAMNDRFIVFKCEK